MGAEIEVFKEIESLELELVDPQARIDPGRIGELLSDDFQEFGSSGKIILKRDVLDATKEAGAVTYQLYDFKFRMLRETCVLVTYRSVTSSHVVALRSSIWVKGTERWQMLHHQSTVVPNSI